MPFPELKPILGYLGSAICKALAEVRKVIDIKPTQLVAAAARSSGSLSSKLRAEPHH